MLSKPIFAALNENHFLTRVMVANTPMDYDKIKIYGTKVKVDSMEQVALIEAAEKEKMRNKVDKILAY